jgi:class 3 adenylate cyclase/ActR/RegA family two-component response regulator
MPHFQTRSSPTHFSQTPLTSLVPLQAPSGSEKPVEINDDDAQGSEAAIVIAEGDIQTGEVLGQVLADLNHSIVIVNTVDQFWSTLEQYGVKLLVLDSLLPPSGGYELCRVLRQAVNHCSLPILLTGFRNDISFTEKAFEMGATDYLTKPFHPPEILSRVRTQLSLLSLQRRIFEQLEEQRIQQSGRKVTLLLSLQQRLRIQSQRLQAKNILLQHEIAERREIERALRETQARSDSLLLNILPAPIADRLKRGESSLADRYEEATILFADIVDFTPLATHLSPLELMEILNQIFSTFDRLVDKFQLEKIKTIGDAYMVAGGVPVHRPDHAEAVMEMAIAMRKAIRKFKRECGTPLQLRIGINTGAVVAGIIGLKKFTYDLWGDAVNVASRMESQGLPGRIQVTESTYNQLKNRYNFEEWGVVNIKRKGKMPTYFFIDRKST